jgi:hypothetical protein
MRGKMTAYGKRQSAAEGLRPLALLWELVNCSSGDGGFITLVVEIRLVLEKGLDPFPDALDVGLTA